MNKDPFRGASTVVDVVVDVVEERRKGWFSCATRSAGSEFALLERLCTDSLISRS